jgi:hypothetical protein
MSAPKTNGSTLASVLARVTAGLAVLAGLGAVTGCNLIVGSGDYVIGDAATVTPSSDGSQPGDVDGSADSSGGGEVDTSIPDTGTTPDAGETPDVGTTADTGPLPDAGPTVGCGVQGSVTTAQMGSASFQQLVTACVMAESCDPDFFDVPLSDCITLDYLGAFPTVPSITCLASAKTCTDYYNCTGNTLLDLTTCDGSNFDDTGTCAGGVATTCFGVSGGGFKANCNVLGGTCTPYASDTDGDMAANCKVLSSCPDTSEGYHCSSTTELYECDDTSTSTIAIGNACPTGSTCRTDANGTHCIYDASSCTTPGTTCVNGNLSSCAAPAGGNEGATYNCAAAGLSCVANTAAGTAACVAPGCAGTTCVESCDDTTGIMTACVGGAPISIDCTTYGFTGCSLSSPDGSNTPYAFCYY